MNLINETFRQLVRRKLWPLALLLVAALVAVPLKLAKTPAPAAATPATAAAKTSAADGIAKPVVELIDTDAPAKTNRRVLGVPKDPFAPAPLPKAKKSSRKTAKKATATPTPAASSAPPISSGGGVGAPPPTATPAPTVTAPKGSVKVRFGTTAGSSEPQPQLLAHLEALPSPDAPVLVLEGLKDNGRIAVFSIPGQVSAMGDGTCSPDPSDCETLELRAGQTEFVTLKGAGDGGQDEEYELDLMKIFARTTAIPESSVAVPAADGSAGSTSG